MKTAARRRSSRPHIVGADFLGRWQMPTRRSLQSSSATSGFFLFDKCRFATCLPLLRAAVRGEGRR